MFYVLKLFTVRKKSKTIFFVLEKSLRAALLLKLGIGLQVKSEADIPF